MNENPHTSIVTGDADGISQAVAHLRSGRTVALPTETVYGLAADAFNSAAVEAIFVAKKRPHSDPLIVHVGESHRTLAKLAADGIVDGSKLTEVARRIVEGLTARFWPGPLTLLLPKGPKIDSSITAGHALVAVRHPDHPVFMEILARLGQPIVAPSANLFGRISPTCADHVYRQLNGRIPLIVDGGECRVGLESTILRIESDGNLTLLRPGGTPVEGIEAALGRRVRLLDAKEAENRAPLAPGCMSSHYAPTKPTRMIASLDDVKALGEAMTAGHDFPTRVGLLLTRQGSTLAPTLSFTFPATRWDIEHLPVDDQGRDAAAGLFSALHRLDTLPLELILVETPTSNQHLWRATRDRLKRATARSDQLAVPKY